MVLDRGWICKRCGAIRLIFPPNPQVENAIELLRAENAALKGELEAANIKIAKFDKMYQAKRGGGCACILNEDGESFASMCIVHKRMLDVKDAELKAMKEERANIDKAMDMEQTDDDDITVTDPTGLMWETSFGKNLTWREAMERPNKLNTDKYGGFSDWRLPTKEELLGLWESKLLPSDKWFWSSSPVADNASYAWGVDFNSGDVNYYYVNNYPYVRCVR